MKHAGARAVSSSLRVTQTVPVVWAAINRFQALYGHLDPNSEEYLNKLSEMHVQCGQKLVGVSF